MKPLRHSALGILILFWCAVGGAVADATVYAAASLTNALQDIAKEFERQHRIPVKLSFGSSAALAKQIEQGAPADLFISADLKWMDYLDDKRKIDHASRRNLLGNTLVLVAPLGKGFPVTIAKGFDFPGAFTGKLCTGQVESVPVGIYAKEALTHLGWWEGLKARLVGTEDVRAALNFVERGECDAGIVYQTDAKQSKKVEILGQFPANTHAPIVYPAALVTPSKDAKAFLDYLGTKPAGEIFRRYGFATLER
ncbi:molybdate ABC transporter substrate-binding protein [Candidatus Methylocalor cossyra]|uniref:Molybdate ABC transporter periplasmic binding protein n=1 Tax=Candidatus Methylocalor cossyra TaxID=3108543 RepID=A0ABM9NIF7_9GAMM